MCAWTLCQLKDFPSRGAGSGSQDSPLQRALSRPKQDRSTVPRGWVTRDLHGAEEGSGSCHSSPGSSRAISQTARQATQSLGWLAVCQFQMQINRRKGVSNFASQPVSVGIVWGQHRYLARVQGGLMRSVPMTPCISAKQGLSIESCLQQPGWSQDIPKGANDKPPNATWPPTSLQHQ